LELQKVKGLKEVEMMDVGRVIASGVFRVGDTWDENGVRYNSGGELKTLKVCPRTENTVFIKPLVL
jgi:hypothetical protein